MFLREEIQFCEISFFSPSRFWLKNIKIKIWKFEISETRFQSMDKENLPPDYREQVSDLTWPLSDPKWPKMTWNDLITWQFYIGWRSAEFTCSKFWGTVQNPHELSRTANKWKVSHQMRHGDDSYITTHIWVINGQYESLKILVPCLEEFHQWHFQQHHRTSTWLVVPVLIRCPGKSSFVYLFGLNRPRPQWTRTIKINFQSSYS